VAALDRLLAELQPLVVRSVRLIVGAASPASEDAAQEALIDVAKGISRLRDPTAVRAWALRVAAARALKVAQQERRAVLIRRTLGRMRPESSALSPAHDERRRLLREAFAQLPPRLRAIAVLRLYVGLSEREAAEVLGCSVGTVKSGLHDARARLAAVIEQAGVRPRSAGGVPKGDAQ
jgi:RNA polymerase sigma factor (sigma-70 family)